MPLPLNSGSGLVLGGAPFVAGQFFNGRGYVDGAAALNRQADAPASDWFWKFASQGFEDFGDDGAMAAVGDNLYPGENSVKIGKKSGKIR